MATELYRAAQRATVQHALRHGIRHADQTATDLYRGNQRFDAGLPVYHPKLVRKLAVFFLRFPERREAVERLWVIEPRRLLGATVDMAIQIATRPSHARLPVAPLDWYVGNWTDGWMAWRWIRRGSINGFLTEFMERAEAEGWFSDGSVSGRPLPRHVPATFTGQAGPSVVPSVAPGPHLHPHLHLHLHLHPHLYPHLHPHLYPHPHSAADPHPAASPDALNPASSRQADTTSVTHHGHDVVGRVAAGELRFLAARGEPMPVEADPVGDLSAPDELMPFNVGRRPSSRPLRVGIPPTRRRPHVTDVPGGA
jgi:hypothetical protein